MVVGEGAVYFRWSLRNARKGDPLPLIIPDCYIQGHSVVKQFQARLPDLPDFEIRQFSVWFATNEEVMRWAMRLGIRQIYWLIIAHGMHTMTHPDILKTLQPDCFALYGGRRDTQAGKRLNHFCYPTKSCSTRR